MAANPELSERDREMALAIYDGSRSRTKMAVVDLICDAMAAAREEGRREAQTWRPIETAPPNDDHIFLWGPMCGLKYEQRSAWLNATHWLPRSALPEPPR